MEKLREVFTKHYKDGIGLDTITSLVIANKDIKWGRIAKFLTIGRPRPKNWKRNAIKDLRPGVFDCIGLYLCLCVPRNLSLSFV